MKSPNVEAEMPSSRVIGRMNNPRLWRKPMQSEMMSPLRTSRRSMERREARWVMGLNLQDFVH
jgi:hypothetical protein